MERWVCRLKSSEHVSLESPYRPYSLSIHENKGTAQSSLSWVLALRLLGASTLGVADEAFASSTSVVRLQVARSQKPTPHARPGIETSRD